MSHRPLKAAPLTLALVCGLAAFVSAQTSEVGRCLLRITGFRAVQGGLAQDTIDLAVPVDADVVSQFYNPVGDPSAPGRSDPTADRALVRGNNAFALDLYGHLANRSGNLFLSPESISVTLAMSYAGAGGETAAEMRQALHFSLDPTLLHTAMGRTLDALTRGARSGNYRLALANGLWLQKGYDLRESFASLLGGDYGAAPRSVDFKSDPADAVKVIDSWTARQTENEISDLLSPGDIAKDTGLVLVDAIYFKGHWDRRFEKPDTEAEPFYPAPGRQIAVPTMHRTDVMAYFEGDGFQALELPYKGGDLAMVVFLPREKDGLAAFEKTLTAARFEEWMTRFDSRRIELSLPKFRLDARLALAPVLQAMGMSRAFDGKKADFSGMLTELGAAKVKPYISAVVHRALIDVNEEGTEAVAATGVTSGFAPTAARPPESIVFKADHPFFFAIRDRAGRILFIGRVAAP